MNIHKKERSKIKQQQLQQYIAHYNYEKHTSECYKHLQIFRRDYLFIAKA